LWASTDGVLNAPLSIGGIVHRTWQAIQYDRRRHPSLLVESERHLQSLAEGGSQPWSNRATQYGPAQEVGQAHLASSNHAL
ncbi:MAG: hypothetical protein ACKPKO_65040, partial [Candidatus Fonsibacter sp.]